MDQTKPKVLVVCGPTATGKSDLAVKLAIKFNGEIISADSRQIFKGLNLGTGKITRREMCGIPHHMLDIVNPQTIYNISKYKTRTEKIIGNILHRKKLPIICGGTGFYIDALINNTFLPEVPPNKKLREKLEKKNSKELMLVLNKVDKERAETIDPNNRRRIIRAIEIAKKIGRTRALKSEPLYHTRQIGLIAPDKIIKERIKKRLLKRLKLGMITEAKKLHQIGLSWKRMESLGLEYRYLSRFLSGKISREQMIEQLNSKIWQYARRQKTWFKKNKNINWYQIGPKTTKKVVDDIKKVFFKEVL